MICPLGSFCTHQKLSQILRMRCKGEKKRMFSVQEKFPVVGIVSSMRGKCACSRQSRMVRRWNNKRLRQDYMFYIFLLSIRFKHGSLPSLIFPSLLDTGTQSFAHTRMVLQTMLQQTKKKKPKKKQTNVAMVSMKSRSNIYILTSSPDLLISLSL